MNPVLQEIIESGRTALPSGQSVPVDSGIDLQSGLLIQRAIRKVRPKTAVEVGLAYGISTLFILEALAEHGGRLIGIDPAQHDQHWRGGGLHNIRRAGYQRYYEFVGQSSQCALPNLIQRNEVIQFALIDGWHTFDHALVDFFYIDQMLETGGIVVLDDVGYPSLRRLCEFILANRDYEVHDCLKFPTTKNLKKKLKQTINHVLYPITRTDKTPMPGIALRLRKLDDVYFAALTKRNHDTRRWDHFVHF